MATAVSQARKGRMLLRRPLYLMIGLGASWLVVLCLVGDNGLTTVIRCHSLRSAIETEIGSLHIRNLELRGEILKLRNTDLAVERYAREELRMTRPGDKVLLLVRAQFDPRSPLSSRLPAPPPAVAAGAPGAGEVAP